MDSDLFKTINWKTSGLAVAYFACKVVGWIWPAAVSICEILEAVIFSGGLLSAADAGRVSNIVQAVDGLLGINKITPAVIVADKPPVS